MICLEFGFDDQHDLSFNPCGYEVRRENQMQRRRLGLFAGSEGDELWTGRSFLDLRLFGNHRRSWSKECEADGYGMSADFSAGTRFPTGAKIFDVGCAFNAQSGAVALSLAHETGQQRWLVTRLGDAAGLDQVSRFFHRGPATGVDKELFRQGYERGSHGHSYYMDFRASCRSRGQSEPRSKLQIPTSNIPRTL